MSQGTAASSAWVLSEESCEANWKSTYSLEQNYSLPLSTHANEQQVSECHSNLELSLQQNLTDTDGLKGEHVYFYLSI